MTFAPNSNRHHNSLWHVNCDHAFRIGQMATKIKMLKFLQERTAFTELNRRPAAKPSALYLMQLRQHMLQTSIPKRRLVVRIDPKQNPCIPHPVKILHVKPPSDT
jgi:hypothetical protein